MILPFADNKKALWNIQSNLECIDEALNEKDVQHFEQELLRIVYPRIMKYAVLLPTLVALPSHSNREQEKEKQKRWRWGYETFLKELKRQIRAGTFDLDKWNADVKRENQRVPAAPPDPTN